MQNVYFMSCELDNCGNETDLSLLGTQMVFLYKKSSLWLNGFFLNGGAREMQEGKVYGAVNNVPRNVSGFIYRVTGCTKSSTFTRVYALNSSFMSRAVSCIQKRGRTSKELKEICEEL